MPSLFPSHKQNGSLINIYSIYIWTVSMSFPSQDIKQNVLLSSYLDN